MITSAFELTGFHHQPTLLKFVQVPEGRSIPDTCHLLLLGIVHPSVKASPEFVVD